MLTNSTTVSTTSSDPNSANDTASEGTTVGPVLVPVLSTYVLFALKLLLGTTAVASMRRQRILAA